jgi:polyisoprenoid-binding protein YceI
MMKASRSRLKSMFYLCVVAPMVLAALSALPQHAAPPPPTNELILGVDPAQSKVHWTLDTTFHTVHGTFAFKNGTLQLDPATGKASGEIVVSATSGDSGNDSRDKKMHKDVLESARFQDVIFRPDRVEGKTGSQGSFTVQVHGVFVLHGTEHELTVPVQAELAGDHWTGNATFNIPFIDWGLKNPSNFFLKVEHTVQIQLEMKGRLQNGAAP